MKRAQIALGLISIFILASCGSNRSSNTSAVTVPQTGGTVFSCSAAPLVEEVESDASFTVSVMASNGNAPYKLNVGTDNSTFTISKTIQAKISNTSSTSKILSGSVQILDATDNAANCSYSITVKPANGGLVCSQVTSVLYKQSTNSCVQSLTSCQTTDLKTQGYAELTTRQQCNTSCAGLSTACSALPDTGSLSCSIAARSIAPYYADQKYEFEVKGVRNGVPVELSVTSFSATPALATSEDLGVNPVNLATIKRISISKASLPAGAAAIQANLLASASLKSDPTIKCGSTTDGALPQFTIFMQKPPVLVCSMQVLNYAYVPMLYAGDKVYIRIAGRKAGLPILLTLGSFNSSSTYASVEAYGRDVNTGDLLYAITWNASVIPSGSSFSIINLGAKAWSVGSNPEYCNDDAPNGGIAGVSFYLFSNP